MNNGDLYDIVHIILDKESKGNVIKPNDFSDLLRQCHYEYYAQEYEKWSGSQKVLDSLSPFVVSDTVDGSAAIDLAVDLTKTYRHLIGLRTSADATAITIETMTPHEVLTYMGDAVMKPTVTYPVANIINEDLIVYPTGESSLNSLTMLYLKEADEDPFFDYYIDANYNVQYLTTGQEYTLQAGEEYRDGTGSGPVTGISVELEWKDRDKINIVAMLLEKLAVSISAPDVAQYAMAKSQQQNVI